MSGIELAGRKRGRFNLLCAIFGHKYIGSVGKRLSVIAGTHEYTQTCKRCGDKVSGIEVRVEFGFTSAEDIAK